MIKLKKTTSKEGFTLAELLIAMVVMGILAGLAIPSYQGLIENNRTTEANSNLLIIQAAQRIYRLGAGNGSFWNFSGNPTAAQINTALTTDIREGNYDITIVTGNATQFIACAQRIGGTRTFFINQDSTQPTEGACPA